MTEADFPALITRLSAGQVEFIVIGGVAATIHGSAHITVDLDVLYRRSADNIQHLAAALAPIQPYCEERRKACRSTLTRRRSHAV